MRFLKWLSSSSQLCSAEPHLVQNGHKSHGTLQARECFHFKQHNVTFDEVFVGKAYFQQTWTAKVFLKGEKRFAQTGLSLCPPCEHAAPEIPSWKSPRRWEESHRSHCNRLNFTWGSTWQLCQNSWKDCPLRASVSLLQSRNGSACASLQAHLDLFSPVGSCSHQGCSGGNMQRCGWEPGSGALLWNSAVQQLCLAAWRPLFTPEHTCLEEIQRKMKETAAAHSPLGYGLPGT